jgi:hypothetical protein
MSNTKMAVGCLSLFEPARKPRVYLDNRNLQLLVPRADAESEFGFLCKCLDPITDLHLILSMTNADQIKSYSTTSLTHLYILHMC